MPQHYTTFEIFRFVFGQILKKKFLKFSPFFHQLLISSLFGDGAIFHHRDVVHVTKVGQPVRYKHSRLR